eukprot:3998275-Pyramimonas_sp.AAC.1
MTFGCSPSVACNLGQRLGKLAGDVRTHMATLGCDLAPGGERCRKGRLSERRARFKNMIRRRRIL